VRVDCVGEGGCEFIGLRGDETKGECGGVVEGSEARAAKGNPDAKTWDWLSIHV
jgi:hypothetical protein